MRLRPEICVSYGSIMHTYEVRPRTDKMLCMASVADKSPCRDIFAPLWEETRQQIAKAGLVDSLHAHVRVWFRGHSNPGWDLRLGVYRRELPAKNEADRLRMSSYSDGDDWIAVLSSDQCSRTRPSRCDIDDWLYASRQTAAVGESPRSYA
jgi:hypothetical protein